MPISRQHSCVFIHIPRTGGTTVEKLLGIHRDWPEPDFEVFHGRFDIDDDYLQLQHLPYREMKTIRDISHTDAYFKFTIVRNPWDRLVSEYFWQDSHLKTSFKQFLIWVADTVNNRTRLTGYYCHYRPQVEFLDDDLDLILRFENYESEVGQMLKRWNMETDCLPRHGTTKRDHYSRYYDAETAEIAGKIYQLDIEKFGYEFQK